jgi:preprotein translocase subunit SecG
MVANIEILCIAILLAISLSAGSSGGGGGAAAGGDSQMSELEARLNNLRRG